MTLIETLPPRAYRQVRMRRGRDQGRGLRRPDVAPLRYRGTGVPMSQAAHRRRPVTPAVTAGLALVAGLITVWLGVVGHFGAAAAGTAAAIPDQLGVVRVQAGESLQQLAARVAPGVPTAAVVQRILELNRLDSVQINADETLIAPIG